MERLVQFNREGEQLKLKKVHIPQMRENGNDHDPKNYTLCGFSLRDAHLGTWKMANCERCLIAWTSDKMAKVRQKIKRMQESYVL